jgi:hypothetical protein
MAIYRAAYLAREGHDESGRTLVLTFNKALATAIAGMGATVLGKTTVETYHKFARGYLSSRGKMRSGKSIVEGDRRRDLVSQAITEKRSSGSDPLLSRSVEFFDDEIAWIDNHGVKTSAECPSSEQSGRFEAAANGGFGASGFAV